MGHKLTGMYIGQQKIRPNLPPQYTVTGSTQKSTFTPSEGSDLQGCYISPDGTKMYLLFWSNKRLYQYSLSTPRNVSTATSVRYISVTRPDGIYFSPDGTYMFIGTENPGAIFRYTLSTAWDISTATQDQTYSIGSGSGTMCTNITITDDGNHLCYGTLISWSDKNNSCYLSTPRDLSTNTNLKTVAGRGGCMFNGGGEYYYDMQTINGTTQLVQNTLATQYDITSTKTQVGIFDWASVTSGNWEQRCLGINSNGQYFRFSNNSIIYLYEAQPIS